MEHCDKCWNMMGAAEHPPKIDLCTNPSCHCHQDWKDTAIVLLKEYARMNYLVSEENWPASKETNAFKAVLDFIEKVHQEGYERGRKEGYEMGRKGL